MFSQSPPSAILGTRAVSPDGRFISRVLGATIAYNFYEHHYPNLLKFLESESEFNKDKDYVLLVVGEVDCRLHLVNQIEKQKTKSKVEVVVECVDRFFRCHLDLKRQGYKVIGWGSHPSSVREWEWCIGPYPRRLLIARHFENRLRQRCIENGIPFKSIFESILKPDQEPDMTKYTDDCHLDPDKVMDVVNIVFADI